MIDRAAPGEVVNTSARFLDDVGVPIITASGAVSYDVYDPLGRFVVGGNATQDLLDLSLYSATFTLPQSLPTTQNNDKYTLRWKLTTTANEKYTLSSSFDVIPSGDDEMQANSSAIVYMPGTSFISYFQFKTMAAASTVTCSIMDETGAIVGSPAITLSSNGKTDTFTATLASLPATAPAGNQGILMLVWQLRNPSLGNHVEIQSNPIYYLTPQVLTLVHAMESMLDKGLLKHVHPYLSWDAATFIHHILKGFEYVNGCPPKVTTFSQATALPVGLTHFIEKAAALSALRAQLMAEGQSAFDFQGMQTQLTVDRTGVLNDLIGQYSADLEKLPDWKKSWINSGSPTGTPAAVTGPAENQNIVTEITTGPYTNYEGFVMDDALVPGVVAMTYGNSYRRGGRRL